MKKEEKTKDQLEKELVQLSIELASRKLIERQSEWIFSRIKDERSKLAAVFNCMPNGVAIIREDHRVEFENRWIQDRFGAEKEKICYRDYFLRETACPNCAMKRALRSGKPEEIEIKTKNERCYKMIASPMGEVDGVRTVVKIIIDVTEQKRAIEATFQSQQKYVDLVNNINVGVYRATPEPGGRFLEVNPALVTILEMKSTRDLIGRLVSDFHVNRVRRKEISDQLTERGFVKKEEAEMVSGKGRRFWASITAVRREDAEGGVFFDGIIEDVTEHKLVFEETRRLNEELKKSNARLKRLASRKESPRRLGQ
ncbi:MAG: PAS domain-containing protein [Candidatus Omnitrophota bacterium]|jgi:PAS domain S-box-containing protein